MIATEKQDSTVYLCNTFYIFSIKFFYSTWKLLYNPSKLVCYRKCTVYCIPEVDLWIISYATNVMFSGICRMLAGSRPFPRKQTQDSSKWFIPVWRSHCDLYSSKIFSRLKIRWFGDLLFMYTKRLSTLKFSKKKTFDFSQETTSSKKDYVKKDFRQKKRLSTSVKKRLSSKKRLSTSVKKKTSSKKDFRQKKTFDFKIQKRLKVFQKRLSKFEC